MTNLTKENEMTRKIIEQMLEAALDAEDRLIALEHHVSGGDDEVYVEGSILKTRAAITAAKEYLAALRVALEALQSTGGDWVIKEREAIAKIKEVLG